MVLKSELTHFNSIGQAHMVDVADKLETKRVAKAWGAIYMLSKTLKIIAQGHTTKGDVLGVARIAGIQAAKRTYELIPLCHPLSLTKIEIEFEIDAKRNRLSCTVTAETVARTGVEMEALTAVNIALLTVYDMCKSVDRGMRIDGVQLLEKRGGKSGHFLNKSDL